MAAGEQHEAAGVADHDQRVLRHVGARTRDAVGEQNERVGVAEVRPVDAHRHVVVAGEFYRKRSPGRADVAGVFAQRRLHVEAQAVDVDMQLILRAAARPN